jgi:glycosyltransferase involved in cell wall biosynthesis
MKRILVISPIPTHPMIAGNRARIERLLVNLKEMGHEVHFLYVNTEPEKADRAHMCSVWGENFYFFPYRYPRRTLGRYLSRFRFLFEKGFLSILPVDYQYDSSLDEFLYTLSAKKKFDVVLVEYIFWTRALECFGNNVLKILDTHDVFTRRHLLYQQAGQSYGWYCTTANEEAKGLNRADVVIAIQEKEREYFSTLTNKKIITVRHIAQLHKVPGVRSVEKKILFVGSNSGANLHGMKDFIHDVLPRIRLILPDLQLLIAGKICDALEDAEGYIRLGEVKDLTPLYEKAGVVINPIQFSTGLSIKTIEALGHGKPVVTTSSGSKGLEEGAGRAFLVADTPEEFSRSVVNILTDPDLSSGLSRNAREFVGKWNRESLKELTDVLTSETVVRKQ